MAAKKKLPPTFEYKVIETIQPTAVKEQQFLNDMGIQGWQLIAYHNNRFIFIKERA